MACSRLVMIDLGEKYQNILLKGELNIPLLKNYVDDIQHMLYAQTRVHVQDRDQQLHVEQGVEGGRPDALKGRKIQRCKDGQNIPPSNGINQY